MSMNASPPEQKWREDFPYQSERDDHITRRDFTRFLLLVSAGFAVGNGWILAKAALQKSKLVTPVDICSENDLPPGQWRVFNYPDAHSPAILIHRQNGEFIAYSQKCTHLACLVAYEAKSARAPERLICHCHNGQFNIATGEGVAGPPRELRPLPRIALEHANGRIRAIGMHEEVKNG